MTGKNKNKFYSFAFKSETILWLAGLFFMIVLLAIAFTLYSQIEELFYFTILTAVIVGLIPFIINRINNYRTQKSYSEQFPQFLLDLNQLLEKNTPLKEALKELNNKFYGSLTTEVKKLSTQVYWGLTLDQAFEKMADRTKNNTISKSVFLLKELKATNMTLKEILRSIGLDLVETRKHYKKESFLKSYPLIVYGLFALFLISLLAVNLILASNLNSFTTVNQTTVDFNRLDFNNLILFFAVIQGIFTAFIVGSFARKKLIISIRNAVIISLIVFVCFQVLIPVPSTSSILTESIQFLENSENNSVTIENHVIDETITSAMLESRKITGKRIIFENHCTNCTDQRIIVSENYIQLKELTQTNLKITKQNLSYLVELMD
ncbi:MAG: type II secretion system F family protein [archaeon]